MSIFNYFFKKKHQPHGVITCYWGKVVAKALRCAYDTGSYMYNNINERPDCCPICHNTLKHIPNKYSKLHSEDDICVTLDGYYIISEKFYNFCKEGNYQNLRIVPLESSKGFYFFEPMDIFGLDYELYKTKFIDKRECCGSYDEVIGPPVIKAKDYNIESNDFIMQAKYYFGSYDKKNIIIIIGTETAKKMKDYGLKGILFKNIYDSENLKITKKEVNKIVLD